jgi:UDP-N-acetyl-D-glucosamine dehydrogenase
VHTRFIELAGEINTAMPEWVVGKVVDGLNQQGKSIKDAKILMLGVAYKKNVDDIRESPAMELLELLIHKNARVDYSDPFFPTLPMMRKHKITRQSVPLTAENIAKFDCVLIATNHDAFDYELVKKHAKLIVDSRGVYREKAPNIVPA